MSDYRAHVYKRALYRGDTVGWVATLTDRGAALRTYGPFEDGFEEAIEFANGMVWEERARRRVEL